MGDRECVLRLLAFMRTSYQDYKANNIDAFLNQCMIDLNHLPDTDLQAWTDDLRGQWLIATASSAIEPSGSKSGGTQDAIRLIVRCLKYGRQMLKHCLLTMLTDSQAKSERPARALSVRCLDDSDFAAAISYGTGDPRKGSAAIFEDRRNHPGDTSMIQSIQLTNFKCFEHQDVVLRPLTLLAGLNSSGKSTIIQALLLLRQSYLENLLAQVGLTLNGKLAQLGTAKDVLFEEADDDEIGFELKDDLPASLKLRFAYREESDVLALSGS